MAADFAGLPPALPTFITRQVTFASRIEYYEIQTMNIFSELLQRKPRTKPIEFDFMCFKQRESEAFEAPSPKILLSSISSNSLENFNVRQHYRMLKEQARRHYNNEQEIRRDDPNRKQSIKSMSFQKESIRLGCDVALLETGAAGKVQRLSFLSSESLKKSQQLRLTSSTTTEEKLGRPKMLSPSVSRLRFLEMEIKAIGRCGQL